ncbi:hypothetical protein [Actinomadura decatromicini]|uniref:Uncharacterized protein n=1 Tax=Actinomadura decatromicini TaxID=2604572 RepID=A0A5D3FBA2_9ACTN|nr:hypothetical protein [Actinomadura decatromicini]TYK45208.1 hypothetical protein FXF68_31520 [Actinomadura decatromicini]
MKIVYRSTHPDVLDHWRNTGSAEAQQAWRARVEETLTDLGLAGCRLVLKGETRVVGVEYDGEPPEGWRRNRDLAGSIAPARRTAVGKEIGKRLDDLRRPDPRRDLPGGMPDVAFAKHTFMRCGIAPHGDAVYVTWPDEIDKGDGSYIDPNVWDRIKLSEYYALLEAEEANAS